jgi:parallel beta-helix repeat protein
MTISNSVITNNTAAGGAGGIGNANGGTVTVTNSTITSNTANDGDGGGIANQPAGSSLTVAGSTIDGNTASGAGGGIFIDSTTTATVANSTISENSADGSGGGLLNAGTATIANVTVSGNSGFNGGGINNTGTATVTNVTVSGNDAAQFGGGLDGLGTETLVNSIVAGNTGAVGDDLADVIEVTTTSLIGVPAGKTLADILDPAGLADNGGPTLTIALVAAAGNPAVDTATSAACAAAPVNGVDQRGFPRPSACDMGAYEIQPTPAPSLPNAAVAMPPSRGSWTALGIAVLLIGALGVLAVANVGVVRRRG